MKGKDAVELVLADDNEEGVTAYDVRKWAGTESWRKTWAKETGHSILEDEWEMK